jgi:hypothetical protein
VGSSLSAGTTSLAGTDEKATDFGIREIGTRLPQRDAPESTFAQEFPVKTGQDAFRANAERVPCVTEGTCRVGAASVGVSAPGRLRRHGLKHGCIECPRCLGCRPGEKRIAKVRGKD